MESFPCPGCAEPMPVGVEVCPACRRPRTEDEVDAARAARRELNAARSARRRRLAGLGALAALAAAAYLQRDALRAALLKGRADFQAELERISSNGVPAPASPATAGAAAPAQAAPDPAAAAGAAPAASVPGTVAPALQAADVEPVKPYDDPGLPHPQQGRVYGVVYDMLTLRPVYPARLRFRLPDKREGESGTDAKGRYQIDLFASDLEGGVTVLVTAEGYREGQLEDSGEPYRLRSLESRKATIAETAPSDLEALRVGRPDGRGLVPLDLVLLPK